MTTVTLKQSDGSVETFECDEETYILDALEEAGLEHPYSCKAGACSTCAMKLEEGSVNQEDQSYLEEEQMDEGFVLTCVAYPTSDTVTLLAEQEENLFEQKDERKIDKVAMTNKLMQLKRELHYKCEIGEKGEWECNGANEYLNRVFDVLDEYWQ